MVFRAIPVHGRQIFDNEMNLLILSEEGIKAIKDELKLRDSGTTPHEAMYDWVDLNHAFFKVSSLWFYNGVIQQDFRTTKKTGNLRLQTK